MAERNPSPELDPMQRRVEAAIDILRALNATEGDSLKESFSPTVVDLLDELSDDDTFFQYPVLLDPSSDDTSSRTADMTRSTPGPATPISSPACTPTRNVFQFIRDDFVPTPTEERMGKFKIFLDQVKDSVRKKLSSEMAEQHYNMVVNTVTDVVKSKFASLTSFLGGKKGTGEGCSFSGRRPTEDFVFNPGPLSSTHPNAPGRNETMSRHSPARNPQVGKVITENPMYIARNVVGFPGEGHPCRSVIRPVCHNPGPSSSPEADRVDRSRSHSSSPSSSPSSSRKRHPLKRQSHVREQD